MIKKKVLIIFGTRPEAIKLAPIIHELKNYKENFTTIICNTGQHKELLDNVLDEFDVLPDITLEVMQKGQSLQMLTSKLISETENIIEKLLPDFLIVHGDTTTAMATALSGFYSKIKICHVEAGLRTNNIYKPFPEEFNRRIVSLCSHFHFAPTENSKQNLISEKIDEKKIFVTGNTVIDALHFTINKITENKNLFEKIKFHIIEHLNFNFEKKKYILITGHRRENFGKGFENICDALIILSTNFPDIEFVYPVHFNPNVHNIVNEKLKNISNIHLVKPFGYQPFSILLKYSYLILTDSGGIQEEAPSLGKPVLLMREETERPEALIAGTVKLVSSNTNLIVDSVTELLKNNELYIKMSKSHNPYGSGDASSKIISILLNEQ